MSVWASLPRVGHNDCCRFSCGEEGSYEGNQIAEFDVEYLHGPAEISYAEDELVVVCLVRDGLPWVKAFVAHYFSLGVKSV